MLATSPVARLKLSVGPVAYLASAQRGQDVWVTEVHCACEGFFARSLNFDVIESDNAPYNNLFTERCYAECGYATVSRPSVRDVEVCFSHMLE